MTNTEQFEIATKAFGLFTLVEKLKALEMFAKLRRYPSIQDRFSEAVCQVVRESK